jgi:hypothetical protein
MNWQRALVAAGTGIIGSSAIYIVFGLSLRVSLHMAPFSSGAPTNIWAILVPYIVLPGTVCFAGSLIAWAVGVNWIRGCIVAPIAHIGTLLIVFRLFNERLYPTEDQNLAFALIVALLLMLLLTMLGSQSAGLHSRIAALAVTLLLSLLIAIPGFAVIAFFLAWILTPAVMALFMT